MKVPQRGVAARLYKVSNTEGSRLVCLCGSKSIHATRQDCTVALPSTPYWDALCDFGEDDIGETVTVELPKGDLPLTIEAFEALPDSIAA